MSAAASQGAPAPAQGNARKFCAGAAAPVSSEVVAAIEAAYGQRSATSLAAAHGTSKGTVTGIWDRAKKAGRIQAMSSEKINARRRPATARPKAEVAPSLPAAAKRQAAARKPKAGQASAEPALVPSAPAQNSSLLLANLTGVAAAYAAADNGGTRTCRWPIGDPRDADFRFCGEVVTTPTVPGADGRGRPNAYCEGCREKAKDQRQAAPFRPAMLGYSTGAGGRAVTAGATRFGRAG